MLCEMENISDISFTSANSTGPTFDNYVSNLALLSLAITEIFSLTNLVVLSTFLATTGIVANVINLCVFYKQGLNNSMNISFFVLVVSDILNLLTLLWRNICANPYIDKNGFWIVFNEIKYLSAGWPNECFIRIISWTCVFITAERCFSITIPLKVKLIFTSRRAVIVLVLIYVVNIVTLLPEYATVYFDWKFYPTQNRSIIGLVYRKNRPSVDGLAFGFNAAIAVSAFFAMIIFTNILIQVLKHSSKWRSKAFADNPHVESLSVRQKKTVSMVIAFASVMIFCYTPTAIGTAVSAIFSDFSVDGKQTNVFHVYWSFAFLFHSINPNINIFLFYKMSSRYKNYFNLLFGRQKLVNKNDIELSDISDRMSSKRSKV